MSYEIVKAKSSEQALKILKFEAGQLVKVTEIVPSANGDGTYIIRVTKVEAIN